MNKFVIAVFPTEAKAYEGVRQLKQLHDEGSVTVFESVVVQRSPNGSLILKKQPEGPIGLGVGALVGTLIGLFGGPVGAAIGTGVGALAGGARDVFHAEVSDEFLDELEKKLSPGEFAVVSEVSEDWTTPVDNRMENIGGKVVREWREDFIDDMIEKRVSHRKEKMAEWKAQRATAKAQRKETQLDAEIERERERLKASADKAKERLDQSKQELAAKLKALEEQASKAKPETRGQVQRRISDLRRDFDARETKLNRAYELAREALRP